MSKIYVEFNLMNLAINFLESKGFDVDPGNVLTVMSKIMERVEKKRHGNRFGKAEHDLTYENGVFTVDENLWKKTVSSITARDRIKIGGDDEDVNFRRGTRRVGRGVLEIKGAKVYSNDLSDL